MIVGRSRVAHNLFGSWVCELRSRRCRMTLGRECGGALSICVTIDKRPAEAMPGNRRKPAHLRTVAAVTWGFVSGCVNRLTVRTNPMDVGVLFSVNEQSDAPAR